MKKFPGEIFDADRRPVGRDTGTESRKKFPGAILAADRRPAGRDAGTGSRTAKEVVTECDLPQPPEKVWKALTAPKILETWLPQLAKGELLEAQPDRLLRYRWPEDESQLRSDVTFELTGTQEGGTHRRVIHRVTASAQILAFRCRKGPRAFGSLRAQSALTSGPSVVNALARAAPISRVTIEMRLAA